MFNIRVAYQTSNCEVCESRKESVDQDIEKVPLLRSVVSAVQCVSDNLDSLKWVHCRCNSYFSIPRGGMILLLVSRETLIALPLQSTLARIFIPLEA